MLVTIILPDKKEWTLEYRGTELPDLDDEFEWNDGTTYYVDRLAWRFLVGREMRALIHLHEGENFDRE